MLPGRGPAPKEPASRQFDQARLRLDRDTDVVILRRFSHGPPQVWRALTEPALICRWLAPDFTDFQIDPHAGGSFPYAWPQYFFSGPILIRRTASSMSSISKATPQMAPP